MELFLMGEGKWPHAITFSLFSCSLGFNLWAFCTENLPSLSINLTVPCSQDVAPKPIWHAGLADCLLVWTKQPCSSGVMDFSSSAFAKIFSLEKFEFSAKFQFCIIRTMFQALQKNAKQHHWGYRKCYIQTRDMITLINYSLPPERWVLGTHWSLSSSTAWFKVDLSHRLASSLVWITGGNQEAL